MKSRKWRIRFVCVILAAMAVTGVALATGTQGSESDPLVTLSYLNEKFLPELLQKADEKIEERAGQLTEQIEAGKTVFKTLEVPAGGAVSLSAGTQLILRSGEAANTDGIIDLTTGSTMWGGLAANHLYSATADGQTVTVSADALFLVLGDHTVVSAPAA